MEDVKQYLKNQIAMAIECFDFDLGEFLAERLLSFDPNCPDAKFLLSKALYLGGNVQRAISTLDSATNHPQSIILYGNCCLKLKLYQDGECALRRWVDFNGNESPQNLATIYSLIGNICRLVGRVEDSKTAFQESLKYNPTYVTSYLGLSDLGTPLKISDTLNLQKIMSKREKPGLSKETFSKKGHDFNHRDQMMGKEPLSSKFTVESRKRGQVNKNPAKKTAEASAKSEKENYSMDDMLLILQKILTAYNALSLFRCRYALEVLHSLPEEHLNSGFVLAVADELFQIIRVTDPCRLKDMDIYATCLWHLKKKVGLCILGKELEDIDRVAPETWCVIGNYFSLLAEHDSAIEACKRAIQLDPNFTYAHTLLGHEYLANEDLEASSNSFRIAMRTNSRHYNAMYRMLNDSYGLGLIELKQEKYLVAEHFFNMALQITPENSILLDVLGQAIQKDKTRNDEALKLYEKALELAPEHRVYLWHKAQLLFEMGEYDAVKMILEKEIANTKPDSQVLFMLGRVFAKLGSKQDAIKYMTLAQDFQEHKSSSIIKDSIGKSLFI
ncbi:hypothetical protein HDV01_005927 [Terramyces sp. JEL0728]|nr:hypothetical protein HDV01_005927 [Terramyces sp. JEL0728]